jgi:hypothetical protein
MFLLLEVMAVAVVMHKYLRCATAQEWTALDSCRKARSRGPLGRSYRRDLGPTRPSSKARRGLKRERAT